jgi:hypothetical protein
MNRSTTALRIATIHGLNFPTSDISDVAVMLEDDDNGGFQIEVDHTPVVRVGKGRTELLDDAERSTKRERPRISRHAVYPHHAREANALDLAHRVNRCTFVIDIGIEDRNYDAVVELP